MKKADLLDNSQRLQLANAFYEQKKLRLTQQANAFRDAGNHRREKDKRQLLSVTDGRMEKLRSDGVVSVRDLRILYQDLSPFHGEFNVFHPREARGSLHGMRKSEWALIKDIADYATIVAGPLLGYLIENDSLTTKSDAVVDDKYDDIRDYDWPAQ